ncbi:unnamed protein product [Adineta ricciae]|uniref:Uncharacterized protein n=2 Tax=Adineta ricciae TaxID=249248 RepID=A0A814VVE7_ADIRI|nr:unnamed protein product [Adineta ricciae]
MFEKSTFLYFLFFVFNLSIQADPQICDGLLQYDKCSTNPSCLCLHSVSSNATGICALQSATCSELVSCVLNTSPCSQPNHICVRHPQCQNQPVCYPLSMATNQLCPPVVDKICSTATWSKHGITVAGGHGFGRDLHQLADPYGIFLDENDAIYIADRSNFRVIKWEQNSTIGQWAAGLKVDGDATHDLPLNMPQDIVVDKNGTIYISDGGNYRVVRWYRGADKGEILVDRVQVVGIGQDNQGFVYVSEYAAGQITKWNFDEDEFDGQIVATNLPLSTFIYIDGKRSIYSAGMSANRIAKVVEDADEPILVAGPSGVVGDAFDQLNSPTGVYADEQETVYIADTNNHRVMRWLKGATSGTLIAGGNGEGSSSDQLNYPSDVFLDREGNLYVTDTLNNRVQKFLVDKSSCQKKK